MSLIDKIQTMASNQTELEKVRAIAKAAATVLTRQGYPTKVVFGKPSGRKRKGGLPGVPGPAGAAATGPKRGPKGRIKARGRRGLKKDEYGEEYLTDIDFDIDFVSDALVRDAVSFTR